MDNTKTFMCDIITGIDKGHTDLEQVLIKAISFDDAFEKLVNKRKYINVHVYEKRDDVLFAHVETKDGKLPPLHILIGEPSEIIE
jgi:hypothetical protein